MRKSFIVSLICAQCTLIAACEKSRNYQSSMSQERTAEPRSEKGVQVDWHAKLVAFQEQLARDPNSASLHSQVAVAYDALGDFPNFDREIQLAMNLDKKGSVYCYFAFATYKRHHLREREIAVLDRALKIDPGNPFGHYEMAGIFEEDKRWEDALREYETTKRLLETVGRNPNKTNYSTWTYFDPVGDQYDVTLEKAHIDDDLARIRASAAR